MTKRIVEPCPTCKKDEFVVKVGMSYTGKRRYACKKCKKSWYSNGSVYFAHPVETYNTEYELDCIERIKELYPEFEIINPRDIRIPDEDKKELSGQYNEFMKKMEKYFFPEIDKCTLLICAKNKNGRISPGVQKEIIHAAEKGIGIETLDVPYNELNEQTINCYNCGRQVKIKDSISNDPTGIGSFHVCSDCEWIDHSNEM